jgi:hypothetical protein
MAFVSLKEFLGRMGLRTHILALALGTLSLAAPAALLDPNRLSWSNNLLTWSNPDLPGGKLEILYPEAFCRKGSTDRDWEKTIWKQKTVLDSATRDNLTFHTEIAPNLWVTHSVSVIHSFNAHEHGLTITYYLHNTGKVPIDLEWFQPACIRVDKFTGCNQSNYLAKSFIFTERGLTTLDKTARRPANEARYYGGQVYVPKGINTNDVNPRPICHDQPTNGLIGCFSADGKSLLAVASSCTHELFEGVYVCLHSDPHIGGIAPNEMHQALSRIYFMKNDVPRLLECYQWDFPERALRRTPAGF